MLSSPRLSLVDRVAAQVLRDHLVTSLPVCPFEIAERNDITVQGMSSGQPGCSGMLVRTGDKFGILYSTDVANEGFQRFSVGHELGHYFLPEHPENVLQHGEHMSKAGFTSSDPYEREADFFAAALLMPNALFRVECDRAPEGLEGVLVLAELCRTSITATAINYAKITQAPVAVVLSVDGEVKCCFQSDTMKRARVGWLRKGEHVPDLTPTSGILRGDIRFLGNPLYGDTNLQEWFGCDCSLASREEVIRLHRPGELLTLLFTDALPDDDRFLDEDDDEEDLVESWTPRFKR